jgi:GntR family transcriptional regulator of vanillate catabolism
MVKRMRDPCAISERLRRAMELAADVRYLEASGNLGMHSQPPSPQVLRATLALRELILTGEWPAGQRLSEPQLAVRVGVSRTPLRLAMEILEHEGLVERRSRGGFAVRRFTLADIEEAVTLRGTLEGIIARLAAEGGPADLAQMESALYEMDGLLKKELKVDILTRYVAANDRFHRAMLDLVHAPLVKRLMRQVVSVPFASPNAFFMAHLATPEARQVLMTAQEQHHAIVEAIAERQGARVEALAREHARLVLRFLKSAARDQESFRGVPGGLLVEFPAAVPPGGPARAVQPDQEPPARSSRSR